MTKGVNGEWYQEHIACEKVSYYSVSGGDDLGGWVAFVVLSKFSTFI